MSVIPIRFHERLSVEQVEEGADLAPKFDERGLIAAVTTDAESGELLMQGYMNAEALRQTIDDIRRQHAENRHVLVVRLDVSPGDFVDGLARFLRRRIDPVIDVRDISRECQFIAPPEHTNQEIEDDCRTSIADVRVVVHSRSTQIHRHVTWNQRFKRNFLSPKRVVQKNRHKSIGLGRRNDSL